MLTACYPASTTWMRHPCILSFHQAERWNSVGAEQCQLNLAEQKSGASPLFLSLPRMEPNCPGESSGHRDTWLFHILFVLPSIRKAGWMSRASENGSDSLPCAECSLLVWDSFQDHLTDSMKGDLKQRNIDVAVIPGCFTPVIQPLDKYLNKPFKDNVRQKYLT